MGSVLADFQLHMRMKTVCGLLLLATVACLGADQHVDEKTMSTPYEAPLKNLVTQSLPRWSALTGPQPNERMGPQPNGVNGPPPYDGMSPQPNEVNGPPPYDGMGPQPNGVNGPPPPPYEGMGPPPYNE